MLLIQEDTNKQRVGTYVYDDELRQRYQNGVNGRTGIIHVHESDQGG